MISIAIQSIWLQLQDRIKQGLEPSLVGIDMVSLSSNVCSDKKAGAINGLLGRGHWVQAEVILPSEVVRDVLKTSIEALVQTHRAKNEVGSALAGSLAQNMQVANVVAAIFAATGQDLAHVVDASQATTIIEPISTDSTDQVYISVTLPSLPVGVVGGGSWLSAQSQARQLIGLGDNVQSWQLAAATGAAVLAGEISGMAALSSNQLACAHQALGRSSQ
jgi:hydroxymethylglutaryl-CoA reductase (NADPH)